MYHPKSRIIQNKFTQEGQFFVQETGEPYSGYYYILSNGIAYTGKFPGDGINRKLTVNVLEQAREDTGTQSILPGYDFHKMVIDYDNLRNQPGQKERLFTLQEPKYVKPVPQYPQFTRYLAKRVNTTVFIEIDKIQYTKLQNRDVRMNWASYTVFELRWKTSGDTPQNIENTNRRTTQEVEKRLKVTGLTQYITNYLEYSI
jgi:hypothetical protein